LSLKGEKLILNSIDNQGLFRNIPKFLNVENRQLQPMRFFVPDSRDVRLFYYYDSLLVVRHQVCILFIVIASNGINQTQIC
jgi:hypothetical protein